MPLLYPSYVGAPESGSWLATGQNRLLALNYIHQGEERLVCAAHEEWGRDFQRQFKPLPPLPPPPRRSSSAASRPAVAEAAAAGGSAGAEAASGARMRDDSASHMEALTGGDANHRQENGVSGNSVSSITSSDDEADVDSKPLVVGYLSPDLFTVRVHRPATCCAACPWQLATHAPILGSWERFSCRNGYLGIRQLLHKGRSLLWRPRHRHRRAVCCAAFGELLCGGAAAAPQPVGGPPHRVQLRGKGMRPLPVPCKPKTPPTLQHDMHSSQCALLHHTAMIIR